MVLFIILHKVVLTFESVEEIPKWNHSNESYWAVLYYDVQGGSNFRVCKLMKVRLHHLNETKSHETLLAAWIHLLFTRLVGYAPYWSSSTCKSRDCRRKEHVIRTCFIDLWLWYVILGLIQHVEQFTIQFALFSFDILDNQHGIIWGFCFALLFHVRFQPFLQTKEQQKTSWLFFLFPFQSSRSLFRLWSTFQIC